MKNIWLSLQKTLRRMPRIAHEHFDSEVGPEPDHECGYGTISRTARSVQKSILGKTKLAAIGGK